MHRPRRPEPEPGPRPGRIYADLVGGLLDGSLLDINAWTAEEIQTGAALMTELGHFGAGGRAPHAPRLGERNLGLVATPPA